ncbi:FAD/NAD(P)-binding oxidoreductase [Caballeronia sp. dw_19]|uniref:FAD/NAD(P)-dependent oxidoreductase n=1 Tax=Caballeronia sp. dw_19 TaxID=2719791 RepID=UPI001BCDEC0A|nr:FAD/NAD(P)-binding oxidoreductase [Caballeronia sp. dw_19]
MSEKPSVVVIGAGPAGIRAAEMLVSAGIRPVMIDENIRCGGQIYRQPPPNSGFRRTPRSLYGFEFRKAESLHATMDSILPNVDYMPETVAWGFEQQRLHVISKAQSSTVPFSHLIIASGATDRVLPAPGWTLAGVYTLGAAQVSLKSQGCVIGQRVVLAGTGPLLYLVAYQYVKAGAKVAAVLDCNSLAQQAAATPRLLWDPHTFAKGVYYVGWLMAHGVRVEHSATVVEILGNCAVEAIRWRRNTGKTSAEIRTIACDGVGLSFGLRPETQLADLAGCRFFFDEAKKAWLPERDASGRSSVSGLYLAGDGASIGGADAAELAGRRAALALLDDIGVALPDFNSDKLDLVLDRKLRRAAIFRSGIEAAFPPPSNPSADWPDSMVICRCEEVTVGELRTCVTTDGISEVNRLKALTRVCMGRCQGRMCGEAAAHVLSHAIGKPLSAVGRIRGQAPVKPIAISPALIIGYRTVSTSTLRGE